MIQLDEFEKAFKARKGYAPKTITPAIGVTIYDSEAETFHYFWQAAQRVQAEDIERLKQRIAELEQASQWQPIETAPELEEVFVCVPIHNKADQYGYILEKAIKNSGFWESTEDNSSLYKPHFWMPLPKPPEALEGKP